MRVPSERAHSRPGYKEIRKRIVVVILDIGDWTMKNLYHTSSHHLSISSSNLLLLFCRRMPHLRASQDFLSGSYLGRQTVFLSYRSSFFSQKLIYDPIIIPVLPIKKQPMNFFTSCQDRSRHICYFPTCSPLYFRWPIKSAAIIIAAYNTGAAWMFMNCLPARWIRR